MRFYKKIDFDNKNDFKLFLEFYNTIYVRAFENEDERETVDNILKQNTLFVKNKSKGIEYCCIVAVEGERVVGGMVADVFLKSQSCALEYVAVDEGHRGKGIGDGLIDYMHKSITSEFGQGAIKYSFFEVENPVQMPESEFDFCMNRIVHWEKRGAKKIDIDYVQPALSEGKNEVSCLFLCCFLGEGINTIEKEVVKSFLSDFFCYGINVPKKIADQKIAAILHGKESIIQACGLVEAVNNIMGLKTRKIGDLFEIEVSKSNNGSLAIFDRFYHGIFIEAFQDENERASYGEYLKLFHPKSKSEQQDIRIDLTIDRYNKPVAGIVYVVFNCIKSVSILFIVVDEKYRRHGLALSIMEGLFDKISRTKGFVPEWLFLEIQKYDGTDKTMRSIAFWQKNGVKKIDFPYVQPALDGYLPLDTMNLCVKNCTDLGANQKQISTLLVEKFLILYTKSAILPQGFEFDPTLESNIKIVRQKGDFIDLKDI